MRNGRTGGSRYDLRAQPATQVAHVIIIIMTRRVRVFVDNTRGVFFCSCFYSWYITYGYGGNGIKTNFHSRLTPKEGHIWRKCSPATRNTIIKICLDECNKFNYNHVFNTHIINIKQNVSHKNQP